MRATLERGVHHRLRGPQGDHRRRRVPARAAAARQALDRRRCSQRGKRVVRVQVRRRRGHLHRRPRVHPAVGLPDADAQGQPATRCKVDPVATVIDGCVGCGLCGENAHAATLCPSFYRAEVVSNPTLARARCSTARARSRSLRAVNLRMRERMSHERRTTRPITVLICALGGEGGGVLAQWLVEAALRCRLCGAEHVDPRRRAAHRRDDLLRRGLPGAAGASSAAPAGVQPRTRCPARSTCWSRPSCSRAVRQIGNGPGRRPSARMVISLDARAR